MPALADAALDQLFRTARSQNGWTDRPVTDDELRALYDLVKFGPTSANCCPARFVFLRTAEGKERLRPALSKGNLNKTMTAPVVAVIGWDRKFYDRLGTLFPHEPSAPSWFNGSEASIHTNGFRNGTLQGAYLILAARALGLDAAPMSGFDAAKAEAEFFPGGDVAVNFICGLGHGDPSGVFPRLPRLAFEDACSLG
jgi:3-hydroxypropanoate dehydrogenase